MGASRGTISDVAVIGGGIAGLACAHALACSGLSITVFEMAPGRGASWAAAGMLAPWAEAPAGMDECGIREEALALYPAWVARLSDESGLPIDMRRSGSLILTESADPAPARERLRVVSGRAPGYRVLAPEEARAEAPLLGPDAAEDSVILPEEGYVDPPGLLRALRRACAGRGVRVREEPVHRILLAGGRAAGVSTPAGDVVAGAVINAGGAWAGTFAPGPRIRPVRGQLVALHPEGDDAPRLNRVIQSSRGYIVPRGDGSVVLGGTSEDIGFTPGVTAEGVGSILAWALRTAPALRGWRLAGSWSGFRPLREGGLLIGSDPEVRSLFHAIGQHRHGILLAPLIGERIREAITG